LLNKQKTILRLIDKIGSYFCYDAFCSRILAINLYPFFSIQPSASGIVHCPPLHHNTATMHSSEYKWLIVILTVFFFLVVICYFAAAVSFLDVVSY